MKPAFWKTFSKLVFVAAVAAILPLAACQQNAGGGEIDSKKFSDAMGKYLSSTEGQQALGKTVEEYFKKRQQEMARRQQDDDKSQIEEQLKNPVKIDIGNSPVKGPENAKVTIIEFSDFQCPYCKRGKDNIEAVLKAYPNDVKLVFKHFPLGFHPHAMPAAKAAVAAQKQGKFWEMHDALFDNVQQLGPDFYVKQAETLGLDVEKFKKDMEDPATEAAVKADQEQGAKNGIQGTPGFFVGGVAVKGAYPFEHFKMIIDKLIAKQ